MGHECSYVQFPFRRVQGIKATARVAGLGKILQPVDVFDCLPWNDGGVLTAMRCYIDPGDVVTNVVTLHATESKNGADLDGPNAGFSGAAAAEFLLASSPPSPIINGVGPPHDGQTIATSKLLGSESVPFERGLYLFAEVIQRNTAAIGGLMYIRTVIEGFTYHRCETCGAFPTGEGGQRK
jgi:hypothetical protein